MPSPAASEGLQRLRMDQPVASIPPPHERVTILGGFARIRGDRSHLTGDAYMGYFSSSPLFANADRHLEFIPRISSVSGASTSRQRALDGPPARPSSAQADGARGFEGAIRWLAGAADDSS